MKSSVVTAWLLAVALIVSATHAFNIGPPAYEELEMQCVTTPEGEPSVTVCWGSHVIQRVRASGRPQVPCLRAANRP
jgi:hypothetical protein